MKNIKPKKAESDDTKRVHSIHNPVFKTICDTCHKACEVPFKPNGKKPVFCDECFKHMREPAPIEGAYVRRKDKTIFDTPENFVQPASLSQATNDTASTIMQLKRELSSANAKLDKLIDMFNKLK
jgi:CxxC-x17-CxxC domain-containing protein